MPLLQVRDVPDDVYKKLAERAKQEHRSIPQQAIVLLRDSLEQKNNAKEKRQATLDRIQATTKSMAPSAPDPAQMIRNDRER